MAATALPGLDADVITRVYACTRKDLRYTARGHRFLSVTLRAANTTVQGRAFRDVDRLASCFDESDIVRVHGRPITFRDASQLEITALQRVAIADPERLLPVAHRDRDELDGFLEHLARDEIYDRAYRALLDTLLSDCDLRARWRRAPCTTDGHHAYLGGLLEHTVAVATLAVETATLHPALNPDLLVTAALVHDLGATKAFTYHGVFGWTPADRRPGVAVLGLRLVRDAARRCAMTARAASALQACLTATHAQTEFAEPSLEAAALRRIDALDSSVAARKVRTPADSSWSASEPRRAKNGGIGSA